MHLPALPRRAMSRSNSTKIAATLPSVRNTARLPFLAFFPFIVMPLMAKNMPMPSTSLLNVTKASGGKPSFEDFQAIA